MLTEQPLSDGLGYVAQIVREGLVLRSKLRVLVDRSCRSLGIPLGHCARTQAIAGIARLGIAHPNESAHRRTHNGRSRFTGNLRGACGVILAVLYTALSGGDAPGDLTVDAIGFHHTYFSARHEKALLRHYRQEFHTGTCPPGLLHQSVGCIAPLHATTWHIGRPLPPNLIAYKLPAELASSLPRLNPGLQYLRIATAILLIELRTGYVVDAIYASGRLDSEHTTLRVSKLPDATTLAQHGLL